MALKVFRGIVFYMYICKKVPSKLVIVTEIVMIYKLKLSTLTFIKRHRNRLKPKLFSLLAKFSRGCSKTLMVLGIKCLMNCGESRLHFFCPNSLDVSRI